MTEAMKAWARYWTGYPRSGETFVSRTIPFRSPEMLSQLIDTGRPVLLALLLPGDPASGAYVPVLEEAARRFEDEIAVVRVNCALCPEFCQSRNPERFPHVEVMHCSLESQAEQAEAARRAGLRTPTFRVNVVPLRPAASDVEDGAEGKASAAAGGVTMFDDESLYGLRHFLHYHGFLRSAWGVGDRPDKPSM
jgi:hypothetical protein